MRTALAICTVGLLLSGSEGPARPPAHTSYANPVLDADFPDPTVIRGGDGTYYAYGTQTVRQGRRINVQVAASTDLVHWHYVGDALPTKPGWASAAQDFWAPHVQRAGKRYVMYLSVKPNGSDDKHGMCLAVATASSPAGPFTDIGHPLKCGAGFVNIDPMAFDDPATGKHLLYWGSGFEPIKVQELSPDRLSFKSGSKPTELVRPNGIGGKFPVLVEGPWVMRHAGFYYLFYSGDNCCGPKANYAVMVARSRSAAGPFQQHGVILAKSSRWNAPGHNSIVTDAAGNDWIVYHAVDSRRPREKATDEMNTRRILLIDRIRWRKGWPVIDGPSEEPRPGPVSR